MPRTPGLAPVPDGSAAQAAELRRLDFELARRPKGRARRVLAMERRRVLVELSR